MPQAWPRLLLVVRLELGNVADEIILDALARGSIRAVGKIRDRLGERADRLVDIDDVGLAGGGAVLGIELVDQIADQAMQTRPFVGGSWIFGHGCSLRDQALRRAAGSAQGRGGSMIAAGLACEHAPGASG